jgi:hypothetical protein
MIKLDLKELLGSDYEFPDEEQTTAAIYTLSSIRTRIRSRYMSRRRTVACAFLTTAWRFGT